MTYLDKQIKSILNESNLTDIAINVGGVIGTSAVIISAAFGPYLFKKYKQSRDCKSKISILQNKLKDSSISDDNKQALEKELEIIRSKCENQKRNNLVDTDCSSEVFSNLENNIKKFKSEGNIVKAALLEKHLKELKIKCKSRKD
jgi:hypothetical protein